jgi:hypothetical protein
MRYWITRHAPALIDTFCTLYGSLRFAIESFLIAERPVIRQHVIDASRNTFTTFRACLDETSRTPAKGSHEIRSAMLG